MPAEEGECWRLGNLSVSHRSSVTRIHRYFNKYGFILSRVKTRSRNLNVQSQLLFLHCSLSPPQHLQTYFNHMFSFGNLPKKTNEWCLHTVSLSQPASLFYCFQWMHKLKFKKKKKKKLVPSILNYFKNFTKTKQLILTITVNREVVTS